VDRVGDEYGYRVIHYSETIQAPRLPANQQRIALTKLCQAGHGFLTEPLGRMLALCKVNTEDDIVHSALRCCLDMISKLAAHIPAEEAQPIVASLKDMLVELYLGPQVISAAVTVFVECLCRYTPAGELRGALVDELYTNCDDEISRVLVALGKRLHYVDE
jgi:hypothetical protein